jgi:hypothetical protein
VPKPKPKPKSKAKAQPEPESTPAPAQEGKQALLPHTETIDDQPSGSARPSIPTGRPQPKPWERLSSFLPADQPSLSSPSFASPPLASPSLASSSLASFSLAAPTRTPPSGGGAGGVSESPLAAVVATPPNANASVGGRASSPPFPPSGLVEVGGLQGHAAIAELLRQQAATPPAAVADSGGRLQAAGSMCESHEEQRIEELSQSVDP